jgi:hypothetical protein
VSVDPERARKTAAEADERQARGEPLGVLHGLPFAVKDTHELAGWRTSFGSPTMADHVSAHDDLHVARILAAGAVPVASRTCPSSPPGRTPSTRCSAPPSTPMTSHAPRAARAGAPRPRSRRAWWHWPTAATWAGRCATPRPSQRVGPATGSGGCRPGRAGSSSSHSASPGPLRHRSRTVA